MATGEQTFSGQPFGSDHRREDWRGINLLNHGDVKLGNAICLRMMAAD